MHKKIVFVLTHFLFISLVAQNVPIGQFKEYLPYNRFHAVAQDDENIYAATRQSILVIDKHDGSQKKWSKLNGLSEIGIQTLHADKEGRLIIAYRNSNIDVIKDYKVHNVRDILNKQLTGSKTINNISTFGDFAYLSCDFGVVVLDLKTLLIKDTWITILQGEPYSARFFTIHNERYYLATDKGVFSLPISALNAADFSMWTQENELPKLPFKLLCSYQNKLFAVRDEALNINSVLFDSLFVYENAHWRHDNLLMTDTIRSFEVKNDKLLVCSQHHIKIFSGSSYNQYYWYPDYWLPVSSNEQENATRAIFDEKMNVWVADNCSGLAYINTETRNYKMIKAEGPINSGAYGLCIVDGALAVVPGARHTALVPVWSYPAISIVKQDQIGEDYWWSHSDFSRFELAGGFNSVAINPLNTNEIYMASWLGGLFKINKATNEMMRYYSANSPLLSERIDSIIFLSGLAIDKQNYLWMTQSGAPGLVKVKDLNTESEKWNSFALLSNVSDVIAEHILVDSRNYKWVTIPRQDQLFVLKGSVDNVEKREIDLGSEATVKSNRITCIAEDREGRIWVGADQGVKVIYDAASVFSKNDKEVFAKNILIKQDISSNEEGYWQYLLQFEYITCIAVDAANRKWIGTQSAGVFLVSPNGTEQLFHFTTENSPLFSNQINDIKINPENGEVFIATTEGLISYRGTATAGRENFKEALVFPNPVRENYFGPIAVQGLMEDSFCKITDAAGNLVWQGYAYGGQLIWNGKDFHGRRPATGVYFVMASSKTGKERKVAKFLFVQ